MLTGSGSSNGSLSGDFDSGHVADGWHLQFLLDGNALEIRILAEGILDAKLYLNDKILDLSSFHGYCSENQLTAIFFTRNLFLSGWHCKIFGIEPRFLGNELIRLTLWAFNVFKFFYE